MTIKNNDVYVTYELQIKDMKRSEMVCIKQGSIDINIKQLDVNKVTKHAEYRISWLEPV